MEQPIRYFEKFVRAYLATLDSSEVQHTLLAQIAVARLAIDQAENVALAPNAAQMRGADFLNSVRKIDAASVKHIGDEATDPDLALLYWEASRGLALSCLLGLCPLSAQERDRLFDRLRAQTQSASDKQTRST